MKLESLKDRPATIKDIGKKFYKIEYNLRGHIIEEYEVQGFDNHMIITGDWPQARQWNNNTSFFWQKPVVISEQEYQSLQQENERLKLIEEQDKALEKDWNECREENKKLRELLNKAEEIIKPLCNSEYSYLRIASEKFLKDLKEAGDE